jgi:hypothetical protein
VEIRETTSVEKFSLPMMINVSTPGYYFGQSLPPTLSKKEKLNIYKKI